MDRLLYATPTGGNPKMGYAVCLRAMEMGIRSFGVRALEDFAAVASPVQMARSQLALRALRGRCFKEHDHKADGCGCEAEPYDYLLMHDDDLMVAPTGPLGSPVDVWHKYMQENPDVGIIGAVYLREGLMVPNVVFAHPDDPQERCQAVAGFPQGVFECGGVGTGFMLISRACLETLADKCDADGGLPMFRFPMRRRREGMVVEDGEDYDFCKRAREAGFKVLADPRFDTVHIKASGQLTYNRDAWEHEWSQENPAHKDVVAALRAQSAPKMKLAIHEGFLVLDHLEQIAEDSKEWRNRQAVTKARKAT